MSAAVLYRSADPDMNGEGLWTNFLTGQRNPTCTRPSKSEKKASNLGINNEIRRYFVSAARSSSGKVLLKCLSQGADDDPKALGIFCPDSR